MANTKMRYIRVDETLWRKAIRKAKADDTNLSTVIRHWLEIYVDDDDEIGDET
jgi:hypothetical protein